MRFVERSDQVTSVRLTRWRPKATGLVERADRLLTRKRLFHYPLILLVMYLLLSAVSIVTGSLPFDALDRPVAVDLSAYVTGARIVLDGQAAELYSTTHQHAVQTQLLGNKNPEFFDLFISPPFVAAAYAPLAFLTYAQAALVWTVLTCGLLVVSLHLLWPLVPNMHSFGRGRTIVIVLASAPAYEMLTGGQNSAISLFLVVVAVRLLAANRAGVAGAALGMGVFKPQLVFLYPLMFAIERRWRAFAGWVSVAGSLAVLSASLVGAQGIRAYVELLTSDTYQSQLAGDMGWKMRTVGSLLRTLSPVEIASGWLPAALQIAVLGLGAALLFYVHHMIKQARTGREAVILSFGMTVLFSTTFAPHAFNYDSVLLLVPFLLFLNAFPQSSHLRVAIAVAYLVALTAPLRFFAFGGISWPLSILAGPLDLIPIFATAVLVLRLLRAETISTTSNRQHAPRPAVAKISPLRPEFSE